MDLQQQAQVVGNIHDTLQGYVGKRVTVRANMGRSKILTNEGTLMQVHPQLFIMEVDCRRGRKTRQSFQFADILTGTVQMFYEDELIFQPFVFETELEAPDTLVNCNFDEQGID